MGTPASADTTGTGTFAHRLIVGWAGAAPFVFIGSVATVSGGVVAALTRPTSFEAGSWLAAYLVLVTGVAQVALGIGQAGLATEIPARTRRWAQAASWNLGSLGVVVGSLASVPALTTLGGVGVIVALGLFLTGVRGTRSGPGWLVLAYRAVIVIVLVSTPVGLALAWARHG